MNPLDSKYPNETGNEQPSASRSSEGRSSYGATFSLNPAGNPETIKEIGKDWLSN